MSEKEKDPRVAFYEVLASEEFISPISTDPETMRRYEEALRKVRSETDPLVEASRRAERMSTMDMMRRVGPSRSFGIGVRQ